MPLRPRAEEQAAARATGATRAVDEHRIALRRRVPGFAAAESKSRQQPAAGVTGVADRPGISLRTACRANDAAAANV